MATRALSQKKLLKSLAHRCFFPRPLNTAASASSSASSSIFINLTEKPESILQNQLAALFPNTNRNTNNSSYINLHNAEKLFSSVSTTKLLRATAKLHLMSMEAHSGFGNVGHELQAHGHGGFQRYRVGFYELSTRFTSIFVQEWTLWPLKTPCGAWIVVALDLEPCWFMLWNMPVTTSPVIETWKPSLTQLR